jgi:hypothetical protein
MAGFFDRMKSFGSNILFIVGILFASCPLIYGAAIFLFQIVHWFKYEVWVLKWIYTRGEAEAVKNEKSYFVNFVMFWFWLF